jgi:hypothetical protein
MIFTQTVFRKKSIKEKVKYQKLHTTVSRFIDIHCLLDVSIINAWQLTTLTNHIKERKPYYPNV